MQDEVFPDKEHFGRIFFNQANLSAAGIPQVAAVMGSCTAGGAYVPAMSDETVIVKEQGTIFLGGPPLVKAATGEVVTAEDLGGGDVHARKSGVVDHLAADDAEALAIVRSVVATFERGTPDALVPAPVEEPVEDPAGLYDVVPTDSRTPYDVREVISRIVDGSRFHEFKALYGETLVCGFRACGASRSGSWRTTASCSASPASRARTSSSLCNQRGIPLVFLQNITGFMVGRERRHRPRRRQRWSPRWRARWSPSSPWSSAARSVPATTACAGGPTTPVPVDVAQRADLGDGRGAGRVRARHRPPRRDRGPGRLLVGGREEAFKA